MISVDVSVGVISRDHDVISTCVYIAIELWEFMFCDSVFIGLGFDSLQFDMLKPP